MGTGEEVHHHHCAPQLVTRTEGIQQLQLRQPEQQFRGRSRIRQPVGATKRTRCREHLVAHSPATKCTHDIDGVIHSPPPKCHRNPVYVWWRQSYIWWRPSRTFGGARSYIWWRHPTPLPRRDPSEQKRFELEATRSLVLLLVLGTGSTTSTSQGDHRARRWQAVESRLGQACKIDSDQGLNDCDQQVRRGGLRLASSTRARGRLASRSRGFWRPLRASSRSPSPF